MSKRKSEIIIIFTVIILDQLIKILMINKQIIIIPNLLDFTYTKNTGVAFGIGNNRLLLIILINILTLSIILKFIKERETQIDKYIIVTLSFILAGGMSNLIDRIFRGYVIDYININLFNFPIFNIADICITIGIFVLIFSILKSIIEREKPGDDK